MVELLIVVAILGILASLIIPVGRRAMDSANAAKCMSNLHQIGVAANGYLGDNDGKLVPGYEGTAAAANDARAWRALFLPYLQVQKQGMKVFSCPSDPTEAKRTEFSWGQMTGLNPTSYAICQFYYYNVAGETLPYPGLHSSGSDKRDYRVASVKKPSSTIFISDIGRPDSVSVPISQWTENGRRLSNANFGFGSIPGLWVPGGDAMYPRHAVGKCHSLFYDGHVAALDLQKDLIDHPIGDPQCLYDNL